MVKRYVWDDGLASYADPGEDGDVCTEDELVSAADYDTLAARLALAKAYIDALEQNLNDFVDLKTMDEAIAWRADVLESV